MAFPGLMEIVGFVASIKELATIFEFTEDPAEIYVSALNQVLDEQVEYIKGYIAFGKREKEAFKARLLQHQIDLNHQPIFPDQLNREIGATVEQIIINELQIINADNRPRISQLVNATHKQYAQDLFEKSHSQSLFLGLSNLRTLIEAQTQAYAGPQQEILERLSEILEDVSENRKFPGTFITPEKIFPNPETSRQVVIGKTVTIDFVRDQRFMDRPDRVLEAASTLDRLIANQQNSGEPEILTFWIDGKSGSGKSVFLLQLLQHLVIQSHVPAWWLYDASENLPLFMETWARFPSSADLPGFIFLDDMYAPQKRGKTHFEQIARLLQNPDYREVHWPVVITCGPPEQHEEFKQSEDSKGFRLQTWTLPLVNKAEQSGLIDWFNHKTGQNAHTGVAFEQADGLMLSLMFEMQHGDLDEFGRRFKTRLENLHLIDLMVEPLALNRLYLGTPTSWFEQISGEQKENLLSLGQNETGGSGDITFNFDSGGRQYISLTHPHLSNAIYLALRPNKQGIQRAEDLVRAFQRTLAQNETHELALRILGSVSTGFERIVQDLDAKTLADGLAATWQVQLENAAIHPDGLAAFWTAWALYGKRDSFLNATLTYRDSIEQARTYLNPGSLYWGNFWQELWDCDSGNLFLAVDAISWLNRTDTKGRMAWAYVWQKLLDFPNSLPEVIPQTTLLQTGFDWLIGREGRPEWAHVWEKLLDYPNALPEGITQTTLLKTGVDWLNGRQDRPEWAHVWRKLLDYPNTLPEGITQTTLLQTGVDWLNGRQDRPEWAHVWRKLLSYPNALPEGITQTTLLQTGFDWLNGRQDRPEWFHVWERLLDFPNALPEGITQTSLIQTGFAWLDGRQDRPGWSHVWEKMFDSPKALPEGVTQTKLIQVGFAWLDGRQDRPDWNHVWQKLIDFPSAIPEGISQTSLLKIGLDWLDCRQAHPGWPFVWKKLLDFPDILPKNTSLTTLLQTGIDWLDGRQDCQHWDMVWKKLLDFLDVLPEGTSLVSLLQTGIDWLDGRQNSPQWDYVWRKLLDFPDDLPQGTSRAALLQIGLDWLDGRQNLSNWHYAWQTLIRNSLQLSNKQVDVLLSSGLQWLNSHQQHISWVFIWDISLLITYKYQKYTKIFYYLLNMGLSWLKDHQMHNSWSIIYEKFLDMDYRHSPFLMMGSEWVIKNTEKPETLGIALKLLKFADTSSDVSGLIHWGNQWLAHNFKHPSWSFMWQRIWHLTYSPEMIDIALSWVEQNPKPNATIWVIVEIVKSDDEIFIGKIQKWLTQNQNHPMQKNVSAGLQKANDSKNNLADKKPDD